VSCNIDNDEFFEIMMKNAYGLKWEFIRSRRNVINVLLLFK
jgi:hypothetical protein